MLKLLAYCFTLLFIASILLAFYFRARFKMETDIVLILLSLGITLYAIRTYTFKFAHRVSGLKNVICLFFIMAMMVTTFIKFLFT